MLATPTKPQVRNVEAEFSLFQLLRPGAIADPYPLYKKLRDFEPVHWDPFLNSWVITSYAECMVALNKFKADRTPSQQWLEEMGLEVLKPYAKLMVQQLLFLDPPSHTRIRSMCSSAFAPRRMERMRERLTQIAHELIDKVADRGSMDLVGEFARPFPALVLATLIGLPEGDASKLLHWASEISELLGNFEHDPDRVEGLVASCLALQAYLHGVLAQQRLHPSEGVITAMMASEVDGEPKLTDDEIVANVMLMIGGGLEEPANLICVGMLSMLERPGTFEFLAATPSAMTSGVEELLRFNSSTQQTGRVAPEDLTLGGKQIKQGQAVTIVVAAANRDPLRFADPDTLDLERTDNRHLAFGWAAHYCLGAPLARLAGQIAFTVLTERLDHVALGPGKPRWRQMAAIRGLTALPLTFHARQRGTSLMPVIERTPMELSEAKRALLARRLKALAAEDEETASIERRLEGTGVRISVDQYRIWLHHTMHPELPLYNEPICIFHAGPLDAIVLERALSFYANRHEAWRTGFRSADDVVCQEVLAQIKVPLAFHDLSKHDAGQREAEDAQLAQESAVQPFDLTRPPLLRAVLVRMSPDEDRLHLVIHHLIFDGTAIRDSFLPELCKIYEALAQGQEPALVPLPLQYPDFAVWREQQIGSAPMQRSLAFWKDKLAGDLPVPRLPQDRPRTGAPSQRGAMHRFTFSAALTSRLRSVGTQHRATLYMVLVASLEVLLYRYSGVGDVVIGTASNGRTRPELQGMMGYMLDTFPIRTQAAASQTFVELLSAVRGELFSALGAADVPFDQVVQAAGSRRDTNYHPIFQTFFSFPPPVKGLPAAWDLQPKTVDTGTAKFDLYIEAEERQDFTAGCILYNTDLFEAATIERLIGHWTTMLEEIGHNPAITLGALPILTSAERRLMLVEWNQTETAVPATTMHGLFEQQARRTPARTAVQFAKRQLTYAALDDRAERFASLLQQAGAGPGKLVAICVDRSENLLASLLGILKTGAAYLPLDPGTPLERILLCLEDAAPVVVLTQRSMIDKLPPSAATTLCLEDLLTAPAELPGLPRVPSGPEDTAYIIHTSGSTGRPKAVELQHGAVVNLLLSFQREPGLTAKDVLIAVTTVSFDIAVLELFLPIITGARVVIAPRSTALDPFELSDLIDETGCTVLQATPATWRSLLAIEWPGKAGMRILCGGEALSRDLAQKLLALGVELWNVYGPTETCIWSTIERVQDAFGAMPIGRPIANTTAYILDANQQPVPVGVAGELYLGGKGLARGYRGQPQLTAEKFIHLNVSEGQRLYRTGDYALYRADGTIVCQGRADNQVKVRGYRIELEEVELHLGAYPDAASAAARVWKDEEAGNRLTGYVVARPDKTIDLRELRRFLQPRLPEYMIPTQIVVLDEMPLTPNGKLNRKALPESALQLAAPQADEAMTEDEVRLAAIWSNLLRVPKVLKHDNFFELGGHSLLMVTMFSRIHREFAINLPLTTIFDAQTLSALAAMLKRTVRISSLVPVRTQGSRPPIFMAHSYLLYHGLSSALSPDQPFYGLRELETDGELSIQQRALLYVADMRSVQPHGPYRVAGWCAAGPLAVEIARQLTLQGESIQSLLLFDAWLPDYLAEMQRAEGRRSTLEMILGKWTVYLAKSDGLTLTGKLAYVATVVRRIAKERRDGFYMNHWEAMIRLSKACHLPLPHFMHNTSLRTLVAMREFKAEMIPVEITLLRATESLQIPSATESCGWERVASEGVCVLRLPGDHESMFRGNNLKITGQLVQSLLDQVAPPGRTSEGSRTQSLDICYPALQGGMN